MIRGSAFFAVEELSYGQHLSGRGTTESWKELRDQDETHLHAIFGQVPRALSTLGILVGAVIMATYWRYRGRQLQRDNRFTGMADD